MRGGAAIVWLLTCTAASAVCQGKLERVHLSRPLAYNPFAAEDVTSDLKFSVRNTGSAACSYRIRLEPADPSWTFGGVLIFELVAGDGPASGPGGGSRTVVVAPVAARGEGQIRVGVRIARGQQVASGFLRARLIATLVPKEDGASAAFLDQVQVPMECEVPAVVQINLAGAGLVTTVDFGELHRDDRRTVVLQTRATQSYRLKLSSANLGALVLASDPHGASRIAYDVELDGQTLNLGGERPITYERKAAEESHRLTITIGEVAGRRAGLYADVVTVRIEALI